MCNGSGKGTLRLTFFEGSPSFQGVSSTGFAAFFLAIITPCGAVLHKMTLCEDGAMLSRPFLVPEPHHWGYYLTINFARGRG